jgi:hypothetical protein
MAQLVNIFSVGVPEGLRTALKNLFKNRYIEVEKTMMPIFKDVLYDYMTDVVSITLKNTSLQMRSGRLAKSLYAGVKVNGSRVNEVTGIYRGIYYSRLHEYGGVLRPTNAEVLTIPMPDALRANGTPKLSSARAWKRFGTFSYTSKKTGRGYLVYKNSAGKLVFLYMYVDKSRYKRKLGLSKTHYERLNRLLVDWGNIIVGSMKNVDLYSLFLNPRKKAKNVLSKVPFNRKLLAPKIISKKG